MTSESWGNRLLGRTGSETHAIINGRGSDQLYLQIIEACNFNFVLQLTLIYLHVDSYGVSWGMRITQVYDAFQSSCFLQSGVPMSRCPGFPEANRDN